MVNVKVWPLSQYCKSMAMACFTHIVYFYFLVKGILNVKVRPVLPPWLLLPVHLHTYHNSSKEGKDKIFDTEIALNIGKEIVRDILYLFLFLVLFICFALKT